MSKEVKNVNCKFYYKYGINRYFILDSISSVILKSSQKLL